MIRSFIITVAVVLIASIAYAQEQKATAKPSIPSDGEKAAAAVKDSPRHGEWVDVPLKEGEAFPLILNFEHAGPVTVEVEVEKTASHGEEAGMEHMHEAPAN